MVEPTNFEPATTAVRSISYAIGRYKEYKRGKILKALDEGRLEVDSSEVKSDEFISSYLATEQALMKASSVNKFNFLLQLFINGANTGRIKDSPDAYQEMLSLVDELSERELQLLFHLYKYETEFGPPEAQLSRESGHQVRYLVDQTGLERELVIALVVRLRRTGLLISRGEKSEGADLMVSGIEIMFISPLADEIKSWVMRAYEGVFRIS